jgi:hypothetical protein
MVVGRFGNYPYLTLNRGQVDKVPHVGERALRLGTLPS